MREFFDLAGLCGYVKGFILDAGRFAIHISDIVLVLNHDSHVFLHLLSYYVNLGLSRRHFVSIYFSHYNYV